MGRYNGWSMKQDEWIPIISPRFAPLMTRYRQFGNVKDPTKTMHLIDKCLKPREGYQKVYAVPRIWKCTSSLYINCIDFFGNEGCFDLVIRLLEKSMEDEDEEAPDVETLMLLSQYITLPHVVLHENFIKQYGSHFSALVRNRIDTAPN